MMRRSSAAVPGRLLGTACLVVLAIAGLAGCGRLGFDVLPDQDASLITVVPEAGEAGEPPPPPPDTGIALDGGDDTSADVDVTCSPACVNAHGTTSCANGTCIPVCDNGFADCNGNASDGCETNLQSDPANCNACMNACVVDSGSAICQGGACAMSSCATGTGDCDKDAGDGCETNLDTSTANCRFCGNACSFANAAASCQAGTCQLGACNDGFANCNGTASDGCEVDLGSTTNHCGACAVACTNANGSTSCSGGACAPSCSSGFGDCDGMLANGCETALNTTSNCGTCGHACTSDAGSPTCSGGTCTTACNLSGTWAVKISVALAWPSSLALATGSGTLQVWAMLKGTQSGNSIPATVGICGITLPDFPSSSIAGNELYGLMFPNTLFDHAPAFLPTVSTTITLGGTTPGSTWSVPTIAFLLGLTLTNPVTDAWPSTPETVSQVDMDQDTKFGITVPYKSGGSYSFVPVNISKSVRADKAYLAARLAASFSATLSTGCTGVTGTATVTSFDTHIGGCEHSTGGDCTTTESDFTDSNRPAYTAGAATLALVKVAAAATCADVRGAL
ncbi:MAG TPA: hypothetical protein VH044_00030 [Polyangiaceae bacterium]|jgi:hypothetical protein|nr:hypothetical protein [Polyangiaceae bacterium]